MTTTSDKELLSPKDDERMLLELAAKAAGIDYNAQDGLRSYPQNKELLMYWNPLTDDGDALRLAVKLNIDVEVFRDKTSTWVVIGCGYFETEEEHNGDPYAATRRAIVRAAAMVGESL